MNSVEMQIALQSLQVSKDSLEIGIKSLTASWIQAVIGWVALGLSVFALLVSESNRFVDNARNIEPNINFTSAYSEVPVTPKDGDPFGMFQLDSSDPERLLSITNLGLGTGFQVAMEWNVYSEFGLEKFLAKLNKESLPEAGETSLLTMPKSILESHSTEGSVVIRFYDRDSRKFFVIQRFHTWQKDGKLYIHVLSPTECE